MAVKNITETRILTTTFNSKGKVVDLEFAYEYDDGDQSEFQAILDRMAHFLAKIKLFLIIMTLLIFISLFITVFLQSRQITAMKEELKEISTTSEWLFFFAKEPELKAPFEDRFKEVFQAANGTGIRTKLSGKCLGADKNGFTFEDDDLDEAVCNTAFRLSAFNPNKDYKFVPLEPTIIAVDLHTGRLYFAITSKTFPHECVAIENFSKLGNLRMGPCTSKDSELFYLDGDDRLMVKKELEQLMVALRAKYYLYNV